MHGDRFVVDATTRREFLLAVHSPQGARPGEFVLTSSGDPSPACNPAPLTFSPARFHLEPGGSQTVIATVQNCVQTGEHYLVLHIGGTDDGGGLDTVVDATVHPAGRTWTLLLYVIFGSLVSVMLNNIFPVSRARTALRSSLRQVSDTLEDPG
jgi:hypothetical protein